MSETPRTDQLRAGIKAREQLRGFVMPEDVNDALSLAAELESKVDSLMREKEEREELLREAANELENEVNGRYGPKPIHPAMERKYQRDMEIVLSIRALVREQP